jgi:hypothetical protein
MTTHAPALTTSAAPAGLDTTASDDAGEPTAGQVAAAEKDMTTLLSPRQRRPRSRPPPSPPHGRPSWPR